MKLRPDWLTWLHNYRRRELEMAFGQCPAGLFPTGLELGAGDGFQSHLLTHYVQQLISSDYNVDRLRATPHQGVTYQNLDAEAVGTMFPPHSFDLVYSSNMLEHVPEPGRVLRGTHHILKDDGVTVHVMPSPFWKFCDLACYVPHRALRLCERAVQACWPSRAGDRAVAGHETAMPSHDNNCKVVTRRRSRFWSLLVPEPHGISATHWQEFHAFSQARWIGEFERAGFTVISVLPGPAASGYGFGLDGLRHIAEMLGLVSEYIYVAVKRGHVSSFGRHFQARRRLM